MWHVVLSYERGGVKRTRGVVEVMRRRKKKRRRRWRDGTRGRKFDRI